jgi:hypothetical protein
LKRLKRFFTPSRTSPKGGRRACLCEDNTYSIKCCDGSLRAQGIGSTTQTDRYLLQEDNSFLLQENNRKIVL